MSVSKEASRELFSLMRDFLQSSESSSAEEETEAVVSMSLKSSIDNESLHHFNDAKRKDIACISIQIDIDDVSASAFEIW